MTITTRDRKLLWMRSGGTCALCKRCISVDAKGDDRDVVLGEEAHIVSERPTGPRFRPMSIKEVDAYANLLLLCPTDHTLVDEHVSEYTEERLHALKREHEQWVKDRTAKETPPIKIHDPEADKPVKLQRIDTGKELMNILARTLATHLTHPDPKSPEEAELIGEFVQNAADYRDIWKELAPSRQIKEEFSLTEEINQLRTAGFVVYAGSKNHVIEGGVGPAAPWPVAYLVLYRSDDETIKARHKN